MLNFLTRTFRDDMVCKGGVEVGGWDWAGRKWQDAGGKSAKKSDQVIKQDVPDRPV